ncbi:hypothetical protein [Actinoplanes sp. NPDC051851]|uniref:hypothetical protein n=1 Tax=Actinoplanes sp. NPDC051851 TaxID=3154753 RepID=UPI0034422367
MTSPRFPAGSTIARRDMLDGRVWTAAGHRVLADDGTHLQFVLWPGTRTYSPTTWIDWFRTGDVSVRKQAIPDLAARNWTLGEWIWQDTAVLTWVGFDPDFNLQYYQPITAGTAYWKLNFERPVTRTPHGIDTFDLLLDLIIAPTADGTGRTRTSTTRPGASA